MLRRTRGAERERQFCESSGSIDHYARMHERNRCTDALYAGRFHFARNRLATHLIASRIRFAVVPWHRSPLATRRLLSFPARRAVKNHERSPRSVAAWQDRLLP
jgi:hypothetical protein